MGANKINQLLELLGPMIAQESQGDLLMAILSNHNPESIVRAKAQISIESLAKDKQQALRMARRIAQASEYAYLDPYRAATHNKGIMNGIDALMIATGNDWRAIEAGVHAYAGRQGSYQPLSRWFISEDGQDLLGQIEIPLQVASVGGTISVHPQAQWSLNLLGKPNAKRLAEIAAGLGLAQNFAAIRAIVSEGIQKGHMALHARSLAVQVGAKPEEMPLLLKELQGRRDINQQVVLQVLDKIRDS